MTRGTAILLTALWIAAPAVWGVEMNPSTGEASTSEPKEFSYKPLKVYSSRGRKDPFLAPMYNFNRPQVEDLKITELQFVGIVSTDAEQIALFRPNSGPEQTLTLKAGTLYDASQKTVPNVIGKILSSKKVLLKQGEEKVTFSAAN